MTDQVSMKTDRWLLPEGIAEVLPAQAKQLELLRRQLLDLYRSWGYDLVMPPLIEYLDSLLVGTGNDLDLQTFKIIDQITGRLMGVRADMTPQVARIDAHMLKCEAPERLCYIGPVLHTRPSGFDRARAPLQVGAELFGHGGPESDAEVLCLMVETLKSSAIEQIHVDLGHVGIFRGLARDAGLTSEQEVQLFEALQRKAKPEIEAYLASWNISTEKSQRLSALVDLNGDEQVLDDAQAIFAGASADVLDSLENLRQIAALVRRRLADLPLYFDLAELRGYRYQTGIVFAAFVPGQGQEIARGGRYDAIGESFGRARPATGFSTDLKTLVHLSSLEPQSDLGILAPVVDDRALDERVAELRAAGERVIASLPGQEGRISCTACDRALELQDGQWNVVSLKH
ncbi:ATP phosphoribosyltransferase regulatory subunit [Pseudomonadota bacterium]